MASTIAAVTTSGGGVVTTADASGNLNLLAGTTTVVALTTAGAAVSGTLGVTGVATLGNGAILGTPASGTVTNLTGTASININGTVGATTPATGAFTTISASGATVVASSAVMTVGDATRTASSSKTTGAIVCGGGLGVWADVNAGGSGNFVNTVSVFTQNPSNTAQGVLFRNTYNTGGSIFSTGAATTNDFILWVGGSGTQGAITGNGAGINYSSNSDYRLKENVAPMTGALAKVAQLKPCTYTWKFDGSDGQGFIAHELQEMFPDAVTGKKDDVEIYIDEDGNEQTKIKPQGVDTSFLVATLTAAIQELKAIIDTQATRIAALEAK